MVIRKSDRVSTVLQADESLIDVFLGLSPAFERLRKPAMRKVMSRLVTVEQAARMAGVDSDELVSRLNAGAYVTADGDRPAGGEGKASSLFRTRTATAPTALRSIPAAAVVEVDVREDLRNGQEPFSRIMAARREVSPGGALCVRAIFEPVPLYAVMEKQGFAHHTEQLGLEDWSVWFYTPDEDPASAEHEVVESVPSDRAATAQAPEEMEAAEDVVVLDVRGLEPPEPLVRTLAALEVLPSGATLVQLNVRVPQFLLPQLEERGFAYEIREQSADLVRLFITRNLPSA
jgi:hypothetical protein